MRCCGQNAHAHDDWVHALLKHYGLHVVSTETTYSANPRWSNVQNDLDTDGSIMVIVKFSMSNKLGLHLLQKDMMTGVRDADELIQLTAKVCAGDIDPDVIPLEENGRQHGARVENELLEAEISQRLEGYFMTQGLHSTQHAWHIIGRAVKTKINHSCTLQELPITLRENWSKFQDMQIWRLITGVHGGCHDVIWACKVHERYWHSILSDLNSCD